MRRGQGGADTGCFQNRRVHPASLAGDPAGAAKLCGSGRHAQGVGSQSSLSSHQRDEPWPVWGLQEGWTGELEAGKGQNQPGPRPAGGSEGHPGGRAWVASTGTRLGTEGKARLPPQHPQVSTLLGDMAPEGALGRALSSLSHRLLEHRPMVSMTTFGHLWAPGCVPSAPGPQGRRDPPFSMPFRTSVYAGGSIPLWVGRGLGQPQRWAMRTVQGSSWTGGLQGEGCPSGPQFSLSVWAPRGAKLDLAEGAMEPEVAGSQGRGLPGLVTSTADRGDAKSHHCDFRTERISEA